MTGPCFSWKRDTVLKCSDTSSQKGRAGTTDASRTLPFMEYAAPKAHMAQAACHVAEGRLGCQREIVTELKGHGLSGRNLLRQVRTFPPKLHLALKKPT